MADNSFRITPSPAPFDNIALAFSGGGFRAASFALGVLAYLQHTRREDGSTLLQRVTYISSASGGSITNALYALSSARGKSFGDFYQHLFGSLEGVRLLNTVFDKLNDDKVWVDCPGKRRNLINAFALAYDELLFDHRYLADLSKAQPLTHLEEVCFNATEFYTGLLFRQTAKLQPDAKADRRFLYGNFMVHLDHDTASGFKIADLVAASSCFPAGFEPMAFPGDFTNRTISSGGILSGLTVVPQELGKEELYLVYGKAAVDTVLARLPRPVDPRELEAALRQLPVSENFSTGFMDGGITDNQGLESMLMAYDRRADGETAFKPFDLMLVNDVGSHFMDSFIPPEDKEHYSGVMGLSLVTLSVLSAVLGLLGLAGLVYCLFFVRAHTTFTTILAVVSALFFLGFGGLYATLHTLKRFISGKLRSGAGLNLNKNFSPQIVRHLIRHFGHTPIGVVVAMLKERLSSVLLLTNDVFLKRIRELLYQRFFGDGRTKNRVKSNHIYDLSFSNDTMRAKNDTAVLAPSHDMQKVAQAAFEMATTLWFDTAEQKAHSQAAVIACGQFSTCYNLLDYIAKLKNEEEGPCCYHDLSDDYKAVVDNLEKTLLADYEKFREDPFWLYNKLGKEYNIEGFETANAAQFSVPDDFSELG